MILTEKEQTVPKPEEEVAQSRKMSQKKMKTQKFIAWEYIRHEINANKSKSRMLVVLLVTTGVQKVG